MSNPHSVMSRIEGRSRKKSAKLRRELAQLLSAAAGNGTHAGKRRRTKINPLFYEVASGLANRAPRMLQLMYEVEYDVDATVQHMIDALRAGIPDSFGKIEAKNIFENAINSGCTLATPRALLVALGRARVGPVYQRVVWIKSDVRYTMYLRPYSDDEDEQAPPKSAKARCVPQAEIDEAGGPKMWLKKNLSGGVKWCKVRPIIKSPLA